MISEELLGRRQVVDGRKKTDPALGTLGGVSSPWGLAPGPRVPTFKEITVLVPGPLGWRGGCRAQSLRVPGSERAKNVTELSPTHPDTAEFSGW